MGEEEQSESTSPLFRVTCPDCDGEGGLWAEGDDWIGCNLCDREGTITVLPAIDDDLAALRKIRNIADKAATIITMLNDPAVSYGSEELEVSLNELREMYHDPETNTGLEDDLEIVAALIGDEGDGNA